MRRSALFAGVLALFLVGRASALTTLQLGFAEFQVSVSASVEIDNAFFLYHSTQLNAFNVAQNADSIASLGNIPAATLLQPSSTYDFAMGIAIPPASTEYSMLIGTYTHPDLTTGVAILLNPTAAAAFDVNTTFSGVFDGYSENQVISMLAGGPSLGLNNYLETFFRTNISASPGLFPSWFHIPNTNAATLSGGLYGFSGPSPLGPGGGTFTPLPEPSTIALGLMGVVGGLFTMRRHRFEGR